MAKCQARDLSCHLTGPHAAGTFHYCLVLWHCTSSTLVLPESCASPSCQPTHHTLTTEPRPDATAFLATSTLGMVKVKALWLSPAFLLYPLITVVLQTYFMYMWRQDQPLHFHLTRFHFISTFWSDQMSLSTPCSAALPFIPTHKQDIDCCLFSSPSWLLFSCYNEGGFSSTFSYNCLFTSEMRAWKNEPISS